MQLGAYPILATLIPLE